jgi:hypothetical protein
MKILINSILIIILITVWGIFYNRNIKNKEISLSNKIIILILIISFNIGALYIFNLSSKKKFFSEFKSIEISLKLNNLDKFLLDKKDEYKELLKKDSVKIASNLLLKHKFNYNPKSNNIIKIEFSDSISYDGKKDVYIVKLSFLYTVKKEEKEIETYLVINKNKINYETLTTIYENILNELLNSIFYEIDLRKKTPDELVSILRHQFNLPNTYYVQIFNHLLKLDSPPVLPDKILLRFLENPSTFSEATGYSIITNNCNTINKIIDRSIYFNSSSLKALLSILVQSKCKVIEGYLNVLKSSTYVNKSIIDEYLKQYKNNLQKEFTYKNGKRVESK